MLFQREGDAECKRMAADEESQGIEDEFE